MAKVYYSSRLKYLPFVYLIFLSMKTNNIKDYVEKEIFGLLNNSKPIVQHHGQSARISKGETPYLKQLAKHKNVYWKSHSRQKVGVSINNIKLYGQRRGAQIQGVNKSKSALYRNLLKEEQAINSKKAIQSAIKSKIMVRSNVQTTSNSFRQCIGSQNNNKNEDLVDSKLLFRQPSITSEKYLKTKAQFRHRHPVSVVAQFKMVKI